VINISIITEAEIASAIALVTSVANKIKTRARLTTSKARDLVDVADALITSAKEYADLPPTDALMSSLKTVASRLNDLVSNVNDINVKLEDASDKLNAIVP
jgi:hypothetical protein